METTTTQWTEITQKLHALTNQTTGEILAKVTFKEFWQYNYTEYLTLEQAKTAAIAAKIKQEQENFPWNA